METDQLCQNAHEMIQIEKELNFLIIYIRQQRENVDKVDPLYERMKVFKKKLHELIEIARKLRKAYNFGSEIFVYFIKNVMENEGQAFKNLSNDYEVDLNYDLTFMECFKNLIDALESIPFSGYSFERSAVPLKEFLPSDYEEIIDSVKNYLDVGYALKDESAVKNIKQELSKLKEKMAVSYYAAIIGPSFMGKTQTAFTLSHCMNVLYMNLLVGSNNQDFIPCNQNIYNAFLSFSKILNKIIAEDIFAIEAVGGDIDASNFTDYEQENVPLKTLGLIFSLIKMKMMRPDINILQWYKNIIDMENIWIPSMTYRSFTKSVQDINLDEVVVFIDELSCDPENMKRTKFIRNLCRSVRIPVILSGTNAKLKNLMVKLSYYISGLKKGFSVWVKIICEVPKSTFKSLGCSIKFKGIDGNMHKLAEFVESDGSGNLLINYDGLLENLLAIEKRNPEFMESLRNFLEMLFEQSKTNLPGIAHLSITRALEQIQNPNLTDAKQLWRDVMTFTSKALVSRKLNLRHDYGLMTSLHTLTFPSSTLRKAHESGEISAKKVDSHYFYYGEKDGEKIFNLNCSAPISLTLETQEQNLLFKDDKSEHFDSCYFAGLRDDVLLNIGCWQVWWNLIRSDNRLFTIRHLFSKYLQEAGNIEKDAAPIELLAHWCICNASHVDLNGFASTTDVMKEFIINVQENNGRKLITDFTPFPTSLTNFLSNITVPYLVQNEMFTNDFNEFIRFGASDRLEGGTGVEFDLFSGTDTCKGYIECKLWNSKVGLADLLPYYEKSGQQGYKITFLLAKKIKRHSHKPKKAKTNTFTKYEKLWLDPQYNINLYSVVSDESTNTFRFNILAEFDNPSSVFILVEIKNSKL